MMNGIQHGLRVLSVVIVLLVLARPLLADEKPVGSVVALRGQVAAVNSTGAIRSLAVKSKLYLVDTIKTGRRARVQMMFDDNTLISLGPNTVMQIAEYKWNPGNKDSAMKTRVEEGVFRIMGGAITQTAPLNFTTDTPAGTIGIRGSMYAGKVSGSSLQVLFQGGKGIFVTNAAGTVSIDRAGFGTFVAGPETPPTAPSRFSGEDLAILEDVSATGPKDPDEDENTEAEGGSGSQTSNDLENGDDAEEATGLQSPTDADDSGTAVETAGASASNSANEGDAAEPASDDQSVQDADSAAQSSADKLPVQDLWVTEAYEDTEFLDEEPLPQDAVLISDLQSAAIEDAADTIQDAASDAVVDGIQTVLQEEVLEIEQAILDLLLEMGFVGFESVSVPADGIEGFDGVVRHKDIESAAYEQSPAKMTVNWYNKKFFGVVEDDTYTDKPFPVFFIGDVNGTAMENMHVLGSDFDAPENRVSALGGAGTFGQFYGNDAEAAGFAAEGVDVDVQNQSDQQAWQAYGALIKKANAVPPSPVPSGTHTLSGFVVGVAEDMAAPDVNRRIFMNSQASDFQFNVNKDNGTISGSLSANDDNSSFCAIANLQIGGGLPSAYVLDDMMIALLGGAGSITTHSSSGPLKEYGNFMVTAKQPDQLAPYTTWGYWEIAYRDPVYNVDYHVHVPGSVWIAGSQTPAAEVNSLISTNFVGTYTGGAEGIRIDPGGVMSKLNGGAANFAIDFNPSAVQPITGLLSFDQVNLNVIGNPGSINASGFSAQISGAAASRVQGAFFGANAMAIGGNFGAKMSSGDNYYGIFAGSR